MAKRLVTAAISHRECVKKKRDKSVCGGNFARLGTLQRDCVDPAYARMEDQMGSIKGT